LVEYGDQIVAIIKAQLRFEALADELEETDGIPFKTANSTAMQFRRVEESLQRLVREYQRERAHFSGQPKRCRWPGCLS
jgi:hypothetical protein